MHIVREVNPKGKESQLAHCDEQCTMLVARWIAHPGEGIAQNPVTYSG